MISKIQRQNAEALDRQAFPLVRQLIVAYQNGDDLLTWGNQAEVMRILQVPGTSFEAVLEYITQSFTVKLSPKRRAKYEPASE